MRNLLIILCGACLLLAIASCAKTTTDSGLGTNTNWLRTCEETSDCEGEDVCVCGQCTQSCTASSQCGSVHEELSCERVEDDVCGESVGIASACLQGCQSNSDCNALEDGRCVSALCVPAARAPRDDGGGMRDDGGTTTIVDGGDPDGTVSDPFALTRQGSEIQITETYTMCEAHTDCELVSTSCNGCCNEGAVRSVLVDTYTARMTPACADYEGGICDCSYEDLVPRCVDDQCAALPREEVECFSQTAPDGAYDAGAVGCNCDAYAMKSICIGRYALMCRPSRDIKHAWIAVEDGPCGEPSPDPDCTSGEVRPTATACLDDFDQCWELENGEFCGVINL